MFNQKILIVEDESIIAEDISDSLISLGYRITGMVYSGEEAIESAAKFRPDLVLMDINKSIDFNWLKTVLLQLLWSVRKIRRRPLRQAQPPGDQGVGQIKNLRSGVIV